MRDDSIQGREGRGRAQIDRSHPLKAGVDADPERAHRRTAAHPPGIVYGNDASRAASREEGGSAQASHVSVAHAHVKWTRAPPSGRGGPRTSIRQTQGYVISTLAPA